MVAAFVGITASILTASVLFQTKPVWVAIVSHLVSFDVAALRQRQAQTIQAVLNGEREHWLSYLLGIVLTAGIVLCLPGVSPSPTRAIPARWTPTRRMPDHPRLSRNANHISDQSAHGEIEGFTCTSVQRWTSESAALGGPASTPPSPDPGRLRPPLEVPGRPPSFRGASRRAFSAAIKDVICQPPPQGWPSSADSRSSSSETRKTARRPG